MLLSLRCCGLREGSSPIRDYIEEHPKNVLFNEFFVMAFGLILIAGGIQNGFEYGALSSEAINLSILGFVVLAITYILPALYIISKHHHLRQPEGG